MVETALVEKMFSEHKALLMRIAGKYADRVDDEETVTTLLDDVALQLLDGRLAPSNLRGYLATALRNQIKNQWRDNRRRQDTREAGYTRLEGTGEQIVANAHSQFGLLAALPEAEDVEIRPEIAHLAAWLLRQLRAGEKTAIEPQESIGHGRPVAARVALHRLRARVRKLIPHYLATLDETEASEVRRFLRRANVFLHT